MIIAALLGALTFGACVDSEESASVTAVRNAKAEQLKSVATLNNAKAQAEATLAAAQAQLAAAEAQLLAAEAAAINAETEAQKIANQIAAAQAAKKIAKIEAEMELAALEYQMELLEAQLAFKESLKDLADDEADALSAAYTSYTTALTDLADAQKALAAKKKDIADEQAKLAKVDTAEEAIAAVNKNIADQTSKVNKAEAAVAATKASIAKLEAFSHSSDQLKNVEIPAAEKAVAAAQKAQYEAYGSAVLALNNFVEINANEQEELYNILLNNYPFTLNGTDVDVIDTFENEVNDGNTKDSWAFYLTKLNDKGVYVQGNDVETAVVLFDNDIAVNVYDEEDVFETTPIYAQRVLFKGIHADAIEAYEAELDKLLSTSDEAIALDKATKLLEAYAEKQQYDDVYALNENYIDDVADVNAQIAEKQAQIKTLTYELEIYDDVNYKGYYDEKVKELKAEIKELEGDIEDLEDELDELDEEYADDLEELKKSIANADTIIEKYAELSEDVIEAEEDYIAKAALYAMEVEVLNQMASMADAWTATYVTEYNAAVVAVYETKVAWAEAEAAVVKANKELATLNTLWNTLKDAPAGSPVDVAKDMLNDLYATLATQNATLATEKATLKGYTDTLAALQNEDADKAAAALAKYVKTMTDNIAKWEAELPNLELQVAIAEASVVSYKAALDALLAE